MGGCQNATTPKNNLDKNNAFEKVNWIGRKPKANGAIWLLKNVQIFLKKKQPMDNNDFFDSQSESWRDCYNTRLLFRTDSPSPSTLH